MPDTDAASLAQISDGVRELRDVVTARVTCLERAIARQAGGHPDGFKPDDQDSGGDAFNRRRRVPAGLELRRQDSWAEWAAEHGRGPVLDPEQFSLGRLVRAMIAGDRGRLSDLERQAVVEGTDSGGGILIGETIAPTILDLVRARTRLVQAGAVVLPMGSDQDVWARIDSGATPAWKAELEAMTESSITFGALHLNAKTLRTKVVLSQEFIEDAPPDAEMAIERELTAAFALEVDRVGLYGAGAGPPPSTEPATRCGALPEPA